MDDEDDFDEAAYEAEMERARQEAREQERERRRIEEAKEIELYGFPVVGVRAGRPIPRLDRVPKERWRELLAPLSDRDRRWAATRYYERPDCTDDDYDEALVIVMDLWINDGKREDAVHGTVPSLPEPGEAGDLKHRPRRAKQVGFRLGPGDHQSLTEAAELFGMRPATLARVLTIRGVHAALSKERILRSEAINPPADDE